MPEAPPASLVVEELARGVLDGVDEEGARQRADLGLLPVFSDERPLQGLSGFVDWRACGRLTGLLRSGLCTGALGERVLLPGRSTLPVDRIVMFGLGDSASFDGARATEVGASLVELARGMSARRVMLAVPTALSQRDATEALFAAVAEGLAQAPPEHASPPEPTLALEPTPDSETESDSEPKPVLAAESEPAAEPETVSEAKAEPELAPDSEPPTATETAAGPAEPASRAPGADADAHLAEVVVRAAQSPSPREQWWAVAETRLVQRLRRLLAGPPRAAAEEGR